VLKSLRPLNVYCKLYEFEEGKHIASNAITVYEAS